MPIPYRNTGPVDCTIVPDVSGLVGKSVIVTGGSSGIGAAYVNAFVLAGAYVTNCDVNPPTDDSVLASANYQFVRCDVRQWSQQVAVFKAAIANSPHMSLDIVIANAGIDGPDPLFKLDRGDEPVEPDLTIVHINYIGVLYTSKLAMHYFNKQQPVDRNRDRCFIITASLGGYVDILASPLLQTSKFAVRALMCNLRRSDRLRANVIAPFFVQTPLLGGERFVQSLKKTLESNGLGFALPEDCARAALRIATDGDINGRAFAIVPRQMRPEGYVDINDDDNKEGTFLYFVENAAPRVTKTPWARDRR